MTWANMDYDSEPFAGMVQSQDLGTPLERDANGRIIPLAEMERREQAQNVDQPQRLENEDVEYVKPITEMTPTERATHEWFTDTGNLEEGVRRVEELVRNNKRVHKRSTSAIFYISGNTPVTTKADLERLKKQLCTDTKRVKFIALGPPEQSASGRVHQHGITIYDTVIDFRKVPRFTRENGEVMSILFGNCTMYSERTGDFKRYIWYMNKNSDDINKCFLMENNGYLQADGTCPPPKKRDINDDWLKCLEMEDCGMAVQTMNNWHPVAFPAKEAQFKRIWLRKHSMRVLKQRIRDNNFTEWKTDMPAVRMINNWIWRAKDPNNHRPGNLFIVGPSLSGKSEFINRKVVLPYNVFKMRGDLMFDDFDDTVNYDFYVLDDMNKIGNEYISICKSLTSGDKGEINRRNIKFSMALVPCKPTIHLMNWEKFHRFMNTATHTGAYNSWWKDNMEVVIVDDYMFPTDRHINEDLNEDEKQAKAFAYKQILYKHPNRRVPVDEGEEDVEAITEAGALAIEEEEEDRKHYLEYDNEELQQFHSLVMRKAGELASKQAKK